MRVTDFGSTYVWSEFLLADVFARGYWVLDLEGTGLDFNSDRITQFGAIHILPGRSSEADTYCRLVNPGKKIPAEIEKLTGITNGIVAGASSFPVVFDEFVQRTSEDAWVTQAGYEYDVPLILAECKRHVIDVPRRPIIDTKALFALLHPLAKDVFNTDFLVNHYGIDVAGLKRHDALGDATIISRIFVAELAEMQSKGMQQLSILNPITIKKSMPGRSPPLDWTISSDRE